MTCGKQDSDTTAETKERTRSFGRCHACAVKFDNAQSVLAHSTDTVARGAATDAITPRCLSAAR